MLDRLIRHGKEAIAAADRDAVINVMVARTSMSREQAAQTLQRWEESYQKARAELNNARHACHWRPRLWRTETIVV